MVPFSIWLRRKAIMVLELPPRKDKGFRCEATAHIGTMYKCALISFVLREAYHRPDEESSIIGSIFLVGEIK
jgi:hypothetical protein